MVSSSDFWSQSPFATPTPTEAPWGSPPWGTWATAMDPLNTRNSTDLFSPNYSPAIDLTSPGTFVYGQRTPTANDMYYDPQWGGIGDSYAPSAIQLGSNLISADLDQYAATHVPNWQGFGGNSGTASNTGIVTSLGGDWAKVDTWTQQILKAVEDVYKNTGVYVPPNFVKSVMKLESGGVPLAPNDSGAVGLMQVTGNTMGNYDYQRLMTDNQYNIESGVNELAIHYNQGDPNNPSNKSWEWAAKRYLGLGPADSNGTTGNTYWQVVQNNWSQLQAGADKLGQTGGNAAAGTKQFQSIWGGFDAPISQGFGMTPFAQEQLAKGQGNEYQYTSAYSLDHKPIGHDGVDVAVNYGTRLYAPAGGTISIIGKEPGADQYFYTTYDKSGQYETPGPNMGELAITMPNKDVYILGHMSQIMKPNGTPYKVGDVVKPGDFVGFSGNNNGAHVHVEYRHYLGPNGVGNNGVNQTETGYLAVDPTAAFGGDFTGVYGGTTIGGPTQAASASNFQQYLQAAIQGKPLTGMTPGSTGGFHDWLYNAMHGIDNKPPTAAQQWLFGSGIAGAPTGGATGPAGPTANSGIVQEAKAYLGAPYVWGSIPNQSQNPFQTGWDCSGFMSYLNAKYGDGKLPAGSHYQYQYAQQTGKLFTNTAQLQPGDLVFFDTGDTEGGGANLNRAGHVGMYLGNDQIISAMNPSMGTVISSFSGFSSPFIGAMHMTWK